MSGPSVAHRRRSNEPYHHGDLRAALIDATIDLIRRDGAEQFTIAEVSRRAGVSAAAPYRRFADREAR
jgi:AcrR family transcriptional regulator